MPWRAVAGFSRPVQVPACRLARSDRPLALPWVCRLRELSSRRWVGMPLAEDPRGSAGIGCAETFVLEALCHSATAETASSGEPAFMLGVC